MSREDYNKDGISSWVIIPVKPLNSAKSRLSPILTKNERKVLAFNLLSHTLTTLQRALMENLSGGFGVVSSDNLAGRLAESLGGIWVREEPGNGEKGPEARLNSALSQAARWCVDHKGAQSILVLPADLPFLKPADLLELLEGGKEQCAQIAPDNREEGTNALSLVPANLLDFAFYFGKKSFKKHLQELKKAGVSQIVINRNPNLTFDLDAPADFLALPETTRQMLLTPPSFEQFA